MIISCTVDEFNKYVVLFMDYTLDMRINLQDVGEYLIIVYNTYPEMFIVYRGFDITGSGFTNRDLLHPVNYSFTSEDELKRGVKTMINNRLSPFGNPV